MLEVALDPSSCAIRARCLAAAPKLSGPAKATGYRSLPRLFGHDHRAGMSTETIDNPGALARPWTYITSAAETPRAKLGGSLAISCEDTRL